MNERWITIGEVAERLEVSRPTARRMLRDGDVPGLVEHFGYSRVERAVFEVWLIKPRRASGK